MAGKESQPSSYYQVGVCVLMMNDDAMIFSANKDTCFSSQSELLQDSIL